MSWTNRSIRTRANGTDGPWCMDVIVGIVICTHLSRWRSWETDMRITDSLGRRWFCRASGERVPYETVLLHWLQTVHPAT
jgi:hypothetical protein